MTHMLVPWTTRFPRGLDVFRNELDNALGRFFGPAEGEAIASFAPHMNVAESEKAYEITGDLPGIKQIQTHSAATPAITPRPPARSLERVASAARVLALTRKIG